MRIEQGATQRRRQAVELNSRALTTYTEIRADQRLSVEGRRDAIARAWWATKKAVLALEAAELKERANRRKTLTDRLFRPSLAGASADVIAQRDAADRVNRLENEDEATSLMKAALHSYDDGLAQAVARRAFSEGWQAPLDEWIKAKPHLDRRGELEELATLHSQAGAVHEVFGHAMDFYVETPAEVSALGTKQLNEIVGEDTVAAQHANLVAKTQNSLSDDAEDYAVPGAASGLAAMLGGLMGGVQA